MRTTFPVYVVALTSVLSWAVFMVFAGVGVIALPVDLIRSFVERPRSVIAKSEYIKVARKLERRGRQGSERGGAVGGG